MFATTGTLVPQRSAELCEANQKRQFLKTEGFSSRSRGYCYRMGKEPPPNFFREKRGRPHMRSALLWEYKYSVVASNAPFRVAPLKEGQLIKSLILSIPKIGLQKTILNVTLN